MNKGYFFLLQHSIHYIRSTLFKGGNTNYNVVFFLVALQLILPNPPCQSSLWKETRVPRENPQVLADDPHEHYSDIRCSVASKIAILRCNVAILMCKLLGQNCNRFDKLPVDRYYSFQCLLQIKDKFKHLKLILNVFSPIRQLERELVYNYTSKLYQIPSKN